MAGEIFDVELPVDECEERCQEANDASVSHAYEPFFFLRNGLGGGDVPIPAILLEPFDFPLTDCFLVVITCLRTKQGPRGGGHKGADWGQIGRFSIFDVHRSANQSSRSKS